ncbi:leucine-rich repeat protein lrrA-like [Corticium candelabrum]|uniref:leucine-rich repeat protein lrrA-like n=1 Tax=Corticium candelabrum TaxID=121492 RepID=UPI002E2628A4|nr:leucine-rich repeat protein lrrA-like [Corticium candelabrum]
MAGSVCVEEDDPHVNSVVDMSSRDLEEVPFEYRVVGRFHCVTQLLLQFNSIVSLPDDLPIVFPALETLNVSGNELETLPDSLSLLKDSLQTLSAAENVLHHIPEGLKKLVHLRVLRLRGNKLVRLDNVFGTNMTNMRELYIDENQLVRLPSELCFMTALEILEASDNKLTYLPDCFGNLKMLKVLNLSNNQLKEVPSSFSQLPSLITLDISNNMLSSMPNQLVSSYCLQSVFLNDNLLTVMSEWFSNTSQLQELDISNNSLEGDALPQAFGLQSPNVQFLSLAGNHVTRLPESLCNMSHLRELKLGSTIPEIDRRAFQNGNWLHSLPEEFGGLVSLERLWLDENKLNCLPQSFGSLSHLTFVDMCQNLLSELPDSFCNLSALVTLYLSRNQLSVLPPDFGKLSQLLEVRLDNNLLEMLPKSFEELTQLKTLDLFCNKLRDFPRFLVNFSQLSRLDLNNNLFKFNSDDVPLSFCKKQYASRPDVEGWKGKARVDILPMEGQKVILSKTESDEACEPLVEMSDVFRRALFKGQSIWKSHSQSGKRPVDASSIFKSCLREVIQFEDTMDNQADLKSDGVFGSKQDYDKTPADAVDSMRSVKDSPENWLPPCEEDWDAEINENNHATDVQFLDSLSASQSQYKDQVVVNLSSEQRAMLRLTLEKGLPYYDVKDQFYINVALQTEKSMVKQDLPVGLTQQLIVEGQFDDL